jgi:predicted nuclease of predicted toxin-antitoxin system
MKVLLDECVPRKLKQHLRQFDCQSVPDLDWTGKKNGELLALAEQNAIEVFVTVDQGIEYQQNIANRRLGIVVLRAKSSRYADLVKCVPEMLRAISTIKPGQLIQTPST